LHDAILRVKKPAMKAMRGLCVTCEAYLWHASFVGTDQLWNFITSGTMSKATMLMILIRGLMAGPAVSL